MQYGTTWSPWAGDLPTIRFAAGNARVILVADAHRKLDVFTNLARQPPQAFVATNGVDHVSLVYNASEWVLSMGSSATLAQVLVHLTGQQAKKMHDTMVDDPAIGTLRRTEPVRDRWHVSSMPPFDADRVTYEAAYD